MQTTGTVSSSQNAKSVAECDEDRYWLECVQRSGSNSASDGFANLMDLVRSGRADDRTLWGLFGALRSLSQECQDEIARRRSCRKLGTR